MKRENRVCLSLDDNLIRYSFGGGHPFCPERLTAFRNEIARKGFDTKCLLFDAAMAEQSQIEQFHTHEYVEKVKAQSIRGEGYLDYGDTPAFKGIYEAAAYVVGTCLVALSQIMKGGCRRAFIPIAGFHHARRDRAGGFCVFNDVGVLIETLRCRYGIKHVAYVDIDAHHGDGVFYAFEGDPHLFIVDIHEDGRFLYPGTGTAEETGMGGAKGTKLNIPMPPYSDDTIFIQIWSKVETFLKENDIEFILFQCGADSLTGDPITHLQFSDASHAYAASSLCKLAEEYCQGRILAMGGGGYNIKNLTKAWMAVLKAFHETPFNVE